jgi:general secretion pathway protein K
VDKLPGEVKTILSDQQGMALLITVMTVSLLIAVTVMFHKKSWHSYLVANNFKIDTQLKAMGESGINIGLAFLQQDLNKNSYDSLFDDWAALTKDDLGAFFGTGHLELEISDLSGKLQINSLVQATPQGQGNEGNEGNEGDNNTANEIRDILVRLLLSPMFVTEEESEAFQIVDALVDWIDEDERESDNGAESSYYQAQENPYGCRNGPVLYIEELLLVRGITPLLLFGEGEKKGLVDYITVHGDDGKININTADSLLIKSLDPLIGDELVERLISFRKDEENREQLESPVWYSSIGSWPGDIVLNENLLTTQSRYFLIQSTAVSDLHFRRVTAVVNRVDKKTVKVLSKKVK